MLPNFRIHNCFEIEADKIQSLVISNIKNRCVDRPKVRLDVHCPQRLSTLEWFRTFFVNPSLHIYLPHSTGRTLLAKECLLKPLQQIRCIKRTNLHCRQWRRLVIATGFCTFWSYRGEVFSLTQKTWQRGWNCSQNFFRLNFQGAICIQGIQIHRF
ncbi:hypothetical protein TNCV_3282981 [Trichonephila clavipes]|nr:hypothetical protein TNCV_3282981 [Trichonephila clavipes]